MDELSWHTVSLDGAECFLGNVEPLETHSSDSIPPLSDFTNNLLFDATIRVEIHQDTQ